MHELIKYPERASAIADKIDDAVTKLSMFIVPYSIVLHPAVLKAIEELVIYFIDGDIEKHTEVEIKQELDRAHAKTNEIITMIRKDLYSDALNSRLVKRLK